MTKASTSQDATPCTACGATSDRHVSAPAFGFAHQLTGAAPQNTGVSGLDHNADRVIGRDARLRWNTVRKRVDRKRGVIARAPGATGFDLSKQIDGDYRVMQPEERQAAESARDLHHSAQDKIKAHMGRRKNSDQ